MEVVEVEGELTEEQIERFRAQWERAQSGRMRLLTPLPRRVRLRLAVTGAVDRAAIRLAGVGDGRAAIWLWRAFGMWQR